MAEPDLCAIAQLDGEARAVAWRGLGDAAGYELLNDALERLEDWEAFAVTVVTLAHHPIVDRRQEDLLRHAIHALRTLAVHSEPPE